MWALLAAAPGLFAGRLLGEWLHPGPLITVLATVVATGTSIFVWRRQGTQRPPWATLPLLLYVFFPQQRPSLAFACAAATLLMVLLHPAFRNRLGQALPAPLAARATQAGAMLVLLAYLALYVHTVAPGLLPADNGELQGIAAQLGVAHPPGFALYTMLSHLATRLPLGAGPAYRANLFSALTSSATLALVFLTTTRLARSRVAGTIAAVSLGTATTFWSQATTANVRSLTAFFAALLLYWVVLITDRRGEHSGSNACRHTPAHLLGLFGLTLSLGVTHHPSLAFMGLLFIAYLLWLDADLLRSARRWTAPALGAVAGLLPLLYFPLRAGANVRGASPALATLSGFLQHVLALGFRGDLFAFLEPQLLGARLRVMVTVLRFQFHPLLLLAMVTGFLLLLRSRPRLGLLLGASLILHTLITATYRAPQTVEYMLPAYVPAALLMGAAVTHRPHSGPIWKRLPPATLALLASAVLVIALGQGFLRYPSFRQLSRDRTARDIAAYMLDGAPRGSVLLADWHWATPLWYLQEVEGQRADVDVHFVFPTAEPYGQTWARRIAEALEDERPVVATHYDGDAYASLPPAEPLGEAFLFRQEPRTSLPEGFHSLDVAFGDRIRVEGYRLSPETVSPTREATLTLAWRPVSPADLSLTQSPISLFAHLVGFDGALYAQDDVLAGPRASGLTLTQLRLTPRPGSRPGEYAIMVGAYENDNRTSLPDGDGAERTRLATLSVSAAQDPLWTANWQYRPLAGDGRILVGYDWDNTLPNRPRLYLHWRTPQGTVSEVRDLPGGVYTVPDHYGPWGLVRSGLRLHNPQDSYYVPLGQGIVWTGPPAISRLSVAPGASLTLPQHFAASRPVLNDLVVSVRLIGFEDDGVQWAWWDLHDSVPALGAIPTLKWVGTTVVRDPHLVTVAEQARPGQTLGGLLTLYDAFTQRGLPILDERISASFLGLPLGRGQVEVDG